jgi:hypothetical protein
MALPVCTLRTTGAKFLWSMTADDSRHPPLFINGIPFWTVLY